MSQSRDGYHAVGSSYWAASLRGAGEVYISTEIISVLVEESEGEDSTAEIIAIEIN